MKIAVIAPYFPPDITGSSIFAKDLVQGLKDLGHSVTVFTTGDVEDGDNLEKVELIQLPSIRLNLGAVSYSYRIPMIFIRFGFISLAYRMKRFNPDVVHVHGHLFDLCLIAIVIAKILRIPSVVTIHSPFIHVNRRINFLLAGIDRLVVAPVLKLATKIVNVDRQTRLYLELRHSKLMPLEIPVSTPSGKVRRGNSESVLEKYPEIKPHKKTILSLGHVIPMRNRKTLIEAFPTILKALPDTQIVIVGKLYDDSVATLVGEMNLQDSVVFTGAVSPTEIPNFLSLADVECHDLQGIGLGLTSLESMQAEVPTVFWMPEDNWSDVHFNQFNLALLEQNNPTEIAEVLTRLLSDPEYKAIVVENQSRLLRNHLSFERVLERYANLFEEVSTTVPHD